MTSSRRNSFGDLENPFANLNNSLGDWTIPENWALYDGHDFTYDLNDANVLGQNPTSSRSRLFSIPSDPKEQPTQSVSRADSAPKLASQIRDLAWLEDINETLGLSTDDRPKTLPGTTISEPAPHFSLPTSSNVYPEPESSFRPSESPYFAALQQNAIVTYSGFNDTHQASTQASTAFANFGASQHNPPLTLEPSTTFTTAPFYTSSSTAPRPMAAPVSRGSSFSREEIRRRSSNSTNSDGYTAALPTQAYRREKPKFDPKHPWHRINTTTRGVTKRSGKINQYEAEKMYKQGLKNPFGTWRSPNYKFEYYEHGELAKLEYTAEEIKDFIYHHPVNSDSKLRMWIQKTPADSGRRYATPTLAKCRFSGCPSRTAGLNGTIWSGHMRVALDERSFKYQEKADPFYMAGYFHLYCVEKFLDLPEICTLPNVEVLADMRQLANEPNMKWSASLSAVKEGIVAQRFIQSCRKGRSRIRDFEAYPRPHTTLPGADKPHELMLNYRMQKVKEGDRARSSKVSLNKRPQRETQVNVNLGDLEVACRAKIAMRKPQPALQSRAKRRQRRSSSWISEIDSDYVSEDEPPERIRKKRRVEEHGPGAVAAEQRHQQAMAPATPAVQLARQQSINNTAYLALGAGYPEYAWPQYTSDPTAASTSAPAPTFAPAANAPASTQISTPSIAPDDLAALLDFATAPSEQPLPLLPDYPPIANGSPADHTTVVRRDLAIPDSCSLTADFTLAKPTKRAAADAEFAAQSSFKRERLSTAAELHSIPLSDISANVPPAAPVRRTDAGGVVDEEVSPRSKRVSAGAEAPGRRRSGRLSEKSAAVVVVVADNRGRRRSSRLSGTGSVSTPRSGCGSAGRRGSGWSSGSEVGGGRGSLGSLGSLFGF